MTHTPTLKIYSEAEAEKFELVSQLIKAKQFKLAYRIATLAMLEYPKEYRS